MRKKMTAIDRAQALGYLKAGHSQSQVDRMVGRARQTISDLAKKARELGEKEALVNKKGRGRKSLATPADIRKALKIIEDDGFRTAKVVKAKMGAQGEKFSVRRVRELLQRAGYGAKQVAKKPMLT